MIDLTNLDELQKLADIAIWEKGIERGFDASGTMEFCQNCPRCNGYHCHIQYQLRSGEKQCARCAAEYITSIMSDDTLKAKSNFFRKYVEKV